MKNETFTEVDKVADLFSEALLAIEKYRFKAYSILINPDAYIIKGVANYISLQGHKSENETILEMIDSVTESDGYLVIWENNIKFLLS